MKTIKYIELLNKEKFINDLKKNGCIIIPKRNYKILGYVLIGIGLLTFFVPFTTIPLVILGSCLLGNSAYHIKESLRKKISLYKYNIKRLFKK